LLLSASDSAAVPATPIWSIDRLQRGEEGQGCSWPNRAPAQSRARATYLNVVSKLNAFASFSLFLPLLSSLSTTALASIFAPPLTLLQTFASLKLVAQPNSTLPAPFHAPCPLPLLLLVVRLRLRANVFSALRPARDRHTPTARPCAACAARSPRARPPPGGPARLSAGQARRVRSPARRVPPVLQPPCARALLSLNARCTLLARPASAWHALVKPAAACRRALPPRRAVPQ